MRERFSTSLLTAFIFAAFGSLWVIFTDDAFYYIADNNILQYRYFQNWKGTLFVAFSALLIYLVNHSLNKRLEQSSQKNQQQLEEIKKLYAQAQEKDQALQDAYERFSLVNKASGEAIWEYNAVSKLLFTNDALKALFDFKEGNFNDIVNHFTVNVHPDDRLRLITRVEAVVQGRLSSWTDEYRFRQANGSYKIILDKGFVVSDAHKKVSKIIGSMQDITLQRNLQEELMNQKITRQKQITQITIQAQEAEKKQLSEELHDNINQLLATVRLYLNHALNNPESAREYIGKSSANILIIIDEIRKLSHSLSPPSMDDFVLEDALNSLIDNYSISEYITFELLFENINEDELSKEKKINIYRIVQEQLNNVLKYAEATQLTISLKKKYDSLELAICDDGVGFDSASMVPGIGFKNIRNRAEMYGGMMEIESTVGNGCKVRVFFEI